jgi:hypothetical protein
VADSPWTATVDALHPAGELIYRALATPKPPQATPAPVTAPKKPISRADVDDILRRKRSASPEELQEIIARAGEFELLEFQRDQLAVDLTLVVAARSRGMNGRRDNPAGEFLSKVLGLSETPYGLISPEWVVSRQMQTGSQAISRCRNHRPPDCQCSSASRAILWQVRAGGEKSPESGRRRESTMSWPSEALTLSGRYTQVPGATP